MLRESKEEAGTAVDTERAQAEQARGAPAAKESLPGTSKSDATPNEEQAAATSEGEPSRFEKMRGFVRRHPVGTAIGAIALVLVVASIVLCYLNARHFETTDDAFVDGRTFSIAPKISGYVLDVPVTDNQTVQAGATIARIDPRDYQAALDRAEAQVAAAAASVEGALAQIAAQNAQVDEAKAQAKQSEAALVFARDENNRAGELVQKGAGTLQRAQQTSSQQRQAEADLSRARAAVNAAEQQVGVLKAQKASADASLAQAKAQLEQAKLDLSYTDVTTAQAGRVARLTGAKGQLVQAGQAISMFVPDTLWVTANFKETQLADMRPGQEVDMTIDAYPGRVLKGRVDSVQPGSGTVFSLLPAQNATGNYVKVVQRVPVKLVFDELPSDVTIGPGMSVVPKVRVR
jgi:membrane fusion protein (multidrug efflux system)